MNNITIFLFILLPKGKIVAQLTIGSADRILISVAKLKENSGAKWTFGLIKHWYIVNHSLRFVFMMIRC